MTEIVRRGVVLTSVLLGAMALFGDGAQSNRAFVYLRPGESSFWHTATNATLELPIAPPAGATTATLTVEGVAYSRTYTGLSSGTFTLRLPSVREPKDENVYCLTLTFDDGTVQTARLGLVRGFSEGARAHARCLSPASGTWPHVVRRAVLPIPYGLSSLTVNGQTVDPGLGGDQGWYALGKARNGDVYALTLSMEGVDYSATLEGLGTGLAILVR